MAYEDKFSYCVRCGADYETRENLRREMGQIYCKELETGKINKRHAYDF